MADSPKAKRGWHPLEDGAPQSDLFQQQRRQAAAESGADHQYVDIEMDGSHESLRGFVAPAFLTDRVKLKSLTLR